MKAGTQRFSLFTCTFREGQAHGVLYAEDNIKDPRLRFIVTQYFIQR